METIGSRVKHRREELGLSQKDVADHCGISQAAVAKIEDGRTRRPRNLLELSEILKTSSQWLLFGTGGHDVYSQDAIASGGLHDAHRNQIVQKIPVWGVVDAQDGEKYAINTEDTPIDWIDPLPVQESDKDAFGLLISGESMSPKYEPGYIVCVNTRKPAIKGKDCVIELKDGGAYLKRYISTSGDDYVFEQLNPAKKLTIKKKDVKRLLPVVAVIYDK